MVNKQNVNVMSKQKGSVLDATMDDFKEERLNFRCPQRKPVSQTTDNSSKRRGRPKKSLNDKESKLSSRSSGKSLSESSLQTKNVNISDSESHCKCTQLSSLEVNMPEPNSDIEESILDPPTVPSIEGSSLPEDLIELEKSVCSDVEKLCPTCKCIVSVKEYRDHITICLKKFRFSKTQKREDCKSRDGVFPCPVCLKKSLSSESERRTHAKSCGAVHGLSTEKILLALKLQEKQEEERRAIGLPPHQFIQNEKDKTRKAAPSRNEKTADPDLQLAFALSRSLADDERVRREKEEDELLSLGLHDVIQEKRRKLVLPQPPPLPQSGKQSRCAKRRKKEVRETVLMTRTKEERERIITERVAALLVEEVNLVPVDDPPKRLLPRAAGALDQFEDKSTPLWTFASSGTDEPLEKHFVADLEEFVKPKHIPVGELMKNMSQIPGRLNYTAIEEDSDEDEKLDEMVETTIVSEYCTQLALAEMLCTQDMIHLSLDVEKLESCEDEDECNDERIDRNSNCNSEVEVLESVSVKEDEVSSCHEEKALSSHNENDGEVFVYFDKERESEPANSRKDQSSSVQEGESVSNHRDLENLKANDRDYIHEDHKEDSREDIHHGKPRENNVCFKVNVNRNSESESGKDDDEIDCDEIKASNISEKSLSKLSESLVEKSCTSPNYKRKNENGISLTFQNIVKDYIRDESFSKSKNQNSLNSQRPKLQQSLFQETLLMPSLYFRLVNDWSCFLSNGDRSDITIVTASGEIPTHCLVLAARCPDILNETQKETDEHPSREWIDWRKVTYDSAFAFMTYLYTGTFTLKKEDDAWQGVFDLSLKYNCTDLVGYLEGMYKDNCNEKNVTDAVRAVEISVTNNQNTNTELFHRDEISVGDHQEESKDPWHHVAGENTQQKEEERSSKQALLKHDSETSDEVLCLDDVSGKTSPLNKKENADGTHKNSRSPDIFGDWDASATPRAFIESPSVTPPGTHYGDKIDESPSLVLTKQNISFRESTEYVNLSPSDKSDLNKSGHKENFLYNAGLKPVTRRNLSHEFKEFPSSVEHDNANCVELPVLNSGSHLSHSDSLSDLDYPSGNEVVDLTLSSDGSSHSFTDGDQLMNDIPTEKRKNCNASPGKVPSPKSSSNIHTVKDKYSHTSKVCALLEAPIQNRTILKPAKKHNRPSPGKVTSPIKLIQELPNLDPDNTSSDKENQQSFHLHSGLRSQGNPNLGKNSPDEVGHQSKSIFNRFEKSTLSSVSDESLLNVVCEVENGLNEPSSDKARNNPKTLKLFRSKSCTSSSSFPFKPPHLTSSLQAYVTPDKTVGQDAGELDSPLSNLKKSFIVTPMPDYKSMMSPELKKELNKYGIRKLSRKKAISLLLHIYEQMHPLVTDSERDTSYAETPQRKSVVSPSNQNTKKNNAKSTSPQDKAKRKAEEDTDDDVLNSSQNSSTSTDSRFECLEESVFADQEDDITSTQQMSMETRLITYIRSNTELYSKILIYEPIWANELHQELKANGLKCSMARLIKFLDDQCITFRLPGRDRTRKRKRRTPVKGPRRKASKKS